jgi:pimeloyl-ACP methyl ester carboxylesterase
MPQDLTLDIDGPVHLVDHGGDGPPMLLVHGLGGSALDWTDVASGLSRDHHVWALDLIGFGRTPAAGRESTIANNQALVDRVAEHIGEGEPVVLVGNSMGGLISIVEASRRPGRVSALVLVDPALPRAGGGRASFMVSGAVMLLAMPAIGRRVMSFRARRLGAERMVDEVLRLCTVDSSRIAPATREAQVRQSEWRHQQDDPYGAFLAASRSLVGWLRRDGPLERYIEHVRVPTLLLHGDRDVVVHPKAARAIARKRPDWAFHVFEDTGHIPQMECPVQFLDVVGSWLAEVRSTAAGGGGAGRNPAATRAVPGSTAARH